MTMWSLNRRGWSPTTPCPEYEKFQRVAEELVANIADSTSLAQLEQVQKGLLFIYLELKERFDPWHFRFPGGHPCLEHCYLEYAMRIRNKALFIQQVQPHQPETAPVPPPPEAPAPYATPEQVVADLGELIQHRPDETVLGEDVEPTP